MGWRGFILKCFLSYLSIKVYEIVKNDFSGVRIIRMKEP